MFRGIGRNIARSAAALTMVAAALFAYSAPASAHTLESAVRSAEGCSWLTGGYSTLHSDAVQTSGGSTYGTVYLLWSSTYQQNCVVTRKTGATHGVATYTRAELWLQNDRYYYEQGNYSHYASTRAAAAGVCVAYRGSIRGTGGVLATGGRPEWGNCS